LDGYSADAFLAKYWHRAPLLIRRAIPGFQAPVSRDALFNLAMLDDVESRIVEHDRGWHLRHGPFERRDLKGRAHPWTLLVQGVNLHDDAIDALMRRFDFVPTARLDDLMISWAADGGGVGPHFDSYDVFLLQAQGRRRWRVSMQRDRALLPGAPLKILAEFRPTMEWVLEPGDMLYLPPGAAHDGVALGECMTYSIGFRAPSADELARGLLEYMADRVDRPGMYADPGLKVPKRRAALDDAYVERAARLIGRIAPTRATIEGFLGSYLSEPKPNVVFDAPDRPIGRSAFDKAARRRGLRLDRRTQMLHRDRRVFINGETVDAVADQETLRDLADQRCLPANTDTGETVRDLLYAWYTHGWLHLGEAP
jgi:50S ribosomal protein L16 3-hydroxylase